MQHVTSATMGACEEAGQWHVALHLLNHMVRIKVLPNDACFSAVLSSLKAPQEWTTALELLSLMSSMSSFPNRIHWNAAMNACASSEWPKALELFKVMSGLMKIDPNTDTLGATIEAYQTANDWQSALIMFNSIPNLQILPDLRSYNNILNVLQNVDYGAEIWHDAVRNEIYPTLVKQGDLTFEPMRVLKGCYS